MTPSAAERVRSILAAGSSLDLVLPELRTHVDGYDVLPGGDLLVPLSADTPLVTGAASGGALTVQVELTDVAPIAMPHRVRAQVTLHARLTLTYVDEADALARVHPLGAQLTEGDRYSYVDGLELAGASPDCLAAGEANLLLHLAHAHSDVLDVLTRLVPARTMQGVVAVLPCAIDRYGLVLRLRYARAEREVRLRFATPLTSAEAVGEQVRALLTRARGCRRRAPIHRDPGTVH